MIDLLQEQERQKYELVWTYEGYRYQADGDPVARLAFDMMKCKPGETLIDWGCGKGTPAAKFQSWGLKVMGVDIAKNCLDKDVHIPLTVACLWDLPENLEADYSFSTDVLEHIPPENLDKVLFNIWERTRKAAFLQVCTRPDSWGAKINPPQILHLCVQPEEWWKDQIGFRWSKVGVVKAGGKARSAFVCVK